MYRVNAGLDYVQDDDAVAALGEIKRVVYFDNVTDPTTLKDKGIEWLTSAQYAKLTIEVTAVDLLSLGVYVAPVKWRDLAGKKWSDMSGITWADLKGFDPTKDKFNIGDLVRCFATPYGMDAVYPIQTLVTYLQDPTKNNITLANEKQQTYTQMQATAEAKIKKEASTVLAEAQANASELIKYANEGNVYIKYNEDGKAVELCVMDTDSPDTATKVWRWTLGGFGYSDTGYDGTYTTAMTMNGEIVADFITVGTMLADRIRGGELILGGLNNQDGVLKMLDASNTQIGKWDKDGIEIKKGAIDIGGSTYDSKTQLRITATHSTLGSFESYVAPNGFQSTNTRNGVKLDTFVGGDGIRCSYGTTTQSEMGAGASNSYFRAYGPNFAYSSYMESQNTYVYGNCSVGSLTNRSKEELKKNIEPLSKSLDKVKLADICTYDLKAEKNGNKHIGMVLGDSYNVPEEIIGYDKDGEPEGIDLYSMCSMLWKAVQELSAEVEELRGGKDAAHK